MGEHFDSIFAEGTLNEIQDSGLDPARTPSCNEAAAGVKTCSYYERCIFSDPKNGGFRDLGPRNIGYSIKLAEWPITKPAHEDFMPCTRFMATMVERMNQGVILKLTKPSAARDDIEIIAQEGDPILIKTETSEEPGSTKNMKMVIEEKIITVPAYPRLSRVLEPKGERAKLAKMREKARLEKERDASRVPA